MADAAPIKFEQQTPAKAKAAAAMVVAASPAIPAPPLDPVNPKAGDRFTPVRGKKGEWRQLIPGDEAGPLVAIVTH